MGQGMVPPEQVQTEQESREKGTGNVKTRPWIVEKKKKHSPGNARSFQKGASL